MSQKVGIGVIGCGMQGQSHLQRLSNLPQAKIIATVDINEERAKMAAKTYGAISWDTDYREALKRRDIEAVTVATPPFAHTQPVVDALEAGKHVFCEKPLALTIEEADLIVNTAKKTGLKLMVGFQNRFIPVYRKIKDLIENGTIGDPVLLQHTGGWKPNLVNSWLGDKMKSGGCL